MILALRESQDPKEKKALMAHKDPQANLVLTENQVLKARMDQMDSQEFQVHEVLEAL